MLISYINSQLRMSRITNPSLESVMIELSSVVSRINHNRFRLQKASIPQRYILSRQQQDLLALRTQLKTWVLMKYQHDKAAAAAAASTLTSIHSTATTSDDAISFANDRKRKPIEAAESCLNVAEAAQDHSLVLAA